MLKNKIVIINVKNVLLIKGDSIKLQQRHSHYYNRFLLTLYLKKKKNPETCTKVSTKNACPEQLLKCLISVTQVQWTAKISWLMCEEHWTLHIMLCGACTFKSKPHKWIIRGWISHAHANIRCKPPYKSWHSFLDSFKDLDLTDGS